MGDCVGEHTYSQVNILCNLRDLSKHTMHSFYYVLPIKLSVYIKCQRKKNVMLDHGCFNIPTHPFSCPGSKEYSVPALLLASWQPYTAHHLADQQHQEQEVVL